MWIFLLKLHLLLLFIIWSLIRKSLFFFLKRGFALQLGMLSDTEHSKAFYMETVRQLFKAFNCRVVLILFLKSSCSNNIQSSYVSPTYVSSSHPLPSTSPSTKLLEHNTVCVMHLHLALIMYFLALLLNFVQGFYNFVCVCSVVSDSLWPHGLQSARLLCSWNFPFLGKNTGVGCHFYSRRSSWPRDQTCVSYISCTRQVGSSPLVLPGKPFLSS